MRRSWLIIISPPELGASIVSMRSYFATDIRIPRQGTSGVFSVCIQHQNSYHAAVMRVQIRIQCIPTPLPYPVPIFETDRCSPACGGDMLA